ncbi:hypothetical protein [Arcobacter sp. LA11]|uniref:hypothetical protein n=1 Tax=Arcobacter sp. LA11 TaxID=1898176 RepID=UPI0009323C1B|nr:hypothetical protein [Arcobacter sp. LA11]
MNENYKNKISKYIYAKDNNKPHLMKNIFTSSAKLDMKLKTENISFPSETLGLTSISKVLINDFNKTYENIYTICLTDSLVQDNKSVKCNWFVIMTEKENNMIRFGYGSYYWSFNSKDNDLVDYLNITIENMIILEKEFYFEIFDWFTKIPYPWADTKIVANTVPDIDLFKPFKIFLDMQDINLLKE